MFPSATVPEILELINVFVCYLPLVPGDLDQLLVKGLLLVRVGRYVVEQDEESVTYSSIFLVTSGQTDYKVVFL